jgi:hypothetical protein
MTLYLLLLYFIFVLNMTTTLLEPASIIATEAEESIASIFGMESRTVPMFLPGGAPNPEY